MIPRPGRLACAAVLVLSACTEPTMAPVPDDGAVSFVRTARPGARPMRIVGTITFVGTYEPVAPCLVHLRSVLSGRATHLGRFDGYGSTCLQIDPATAVPDPAPPFVPAGPPPYITAPFSNPLWVLRAANGDELWLATTEAVAVLSVDGSVRAEGTHVILGGTGRFAGATGLLASVGENADGRGPDDLRSEGWIRF